MLPYESRENGSTYSTPRVNTRSLGLTLKHVCNPSPNKITPLVLTPGCHPIGVTRPWFLNDQPLGYDGHFEFTPAYCVKLETVQSNSICVPTTDQILTHCSAIFRYKVYASCAGPRILWGP